MEITEHTRLNKVLDLGPQVLEYIVALDPHDFSRLHNPVMRRLMPPRITIGRVTAIAGVPVETVLADISALGGVEASLPAVRAATWPASPAERPDWVSEASAAPNSVTVVDLLPLDETLDTDPMPPVMNAVLALGEGDVCRIRHKSEPQPFYDVWERMGGLEWFAEQQSPDEWWIWMRRVPGQ